MRKSHKRVRRVSYDKQKSNFGFTETFTMFTKRYGKEIILELIFSSIKKVLKIVVNGK